MELSQKNILFLIAAVALLLAIPFTIVQLKQQQETRSRASGQGASLTLNPQTATRNIDEEFAIEVGIDPNGNAVKGVDFTMIIDTNVLEFIRFDPSSTLTDVLINTFDQQIGVLHVAGIDTSSEKSTQPFIVGELLVKAKALGNGSITFSDKTIQIVAVGTQGNIASLSNAVGSYVVEGATIEPTLAPKTASFILTPKITTKQLNDTFDVRLDLNTGSNNITGVDVTLAFNKDVLTLNAFEPTDVFDTPLIETIDNTEGTLRFSAVDIEDAKNGVLSLGTLTFLAKALGTSSAEFVHAQVSALGEPELLDTANNTRSLYTVVETLPTPTPIIIPTPPLIPPGAPCDASKQCPLDLVCRPIILAYGSLSSQDEAVQQYCLPQPPTETPLPTPTINPNDTYVSLTVSLPGISSAAAVSTRSAQAASIAAREATVQLINADGEIVKETTETITYDSASGTFKATVDLGADIATNVYTIKVDTAKYLRKLVPGIQTITARTTNQITSVSLIAGDITDDNQLNIADYNILTSCYGSKPCSQKEAADLTEDGIVDGIDYSLFIRNMSTRSGD